MQKVEFLGAQNTPFEGAQTRYEILCPSFIFSTLRMSYVKMATSEGGEWGRGEWGMGNLHIRSWETTITRNL